jgi:starch synthase
MPKFGNINERRHKLHEVVRLSGMNIIVDDDDFPLIIKVATLAPYRLQIYFLDNEEFFKRKSVFLDDDEKPFDDNSDRMIFFCKGVLETLKKFGWAPDIIHCHGWMTSLVPLYLKKVYNNEPIFQDSKIIFSAFENEMDDNFKTRFLSKATINEMSDEDLTDYIVDDKINLNKGAMVHSDAVVIGSEALTDFVQTNASDKVILDYQSQEQLIDAYIGLYNSLVETAEE